MSLKEIISASLEGKMATLKIASDAVEVWADELEKVIKHVLPKSYVEVKLSKGAVPAREGNGSTRNVGMVLKFALGEKNEIPVTLHNDPMYHVVMINTKPYDSFPRDGSLPMQLSVESSLGGSLHVSPEAGSIYAFDRVKLGWRNKTGSPDAIKRYLVEYCEKVKKVVQQNAERLPENMRKKY